MFTAGNALFLNTFFEAFCKMSKLGAKEALSSASLCDPCVGAAEITVAEVFDLERDLGGATTKAGASRRSKQSNRIDEIKNMTIPLDGKGTEFGAAQVVDLPADLEALVELHENLKDKGNANITTAVFGSTADEAVVVNLATIEFEAKSSGDSADCF